MVLTIMIWKLTTIFLWILSLSECHEIISLVVPLIADPRENATLSCKYRMGRDFLYSAKWFKDDREIFRYMPKQRLPGLSFPVAGVTIAKEPQCTDTDCDIELTNLVPQSEANYRCEISTEAPKFAVVEKGSNLTVAALPKKDPQIDGLSPRYSIGDEIKINCTSDPTLPPWELKWFINDVEPSFLNIEGPWTSEPDRFGLTRTQIGFKRIVDKTLFRNKELKVRCVALAPPSLVDGPYKRETTQYSGQHSPSFLDLSWSSGAEKKSRYSIFWASFLCSFLFSPYNNIF